MKQIRTSPAALLRIKKYTETLRGRIKALLKGAKASAQAKSYEFSITEDYLLELWERQNGRCSYTGVAMSTATKCPNLVSIDRVDSKVGYVIGNIQLCCWRVNRAKNSMNEDEFLFMCKQVVSHLDR
jgi:hypothetical protein